MADQFMYIPNDDTQNTRTEDLNQWLKRLNTQVNETTNKNSLKSQKL